MMRQHICPDDHKHGQTPTCYRQHKCACAACRTANAERCYTRRKLIAYGRWQPATVDATRARTHLFRLLDIGHTTTAVASMADVTTSAIRHLLHGKPHNGRPGIPSRRIDRDASERILAVTTDLMLVPAHLKLNSRGARRRLQALAIQGWSRAEISSRTGMPTSALDNVARADRISASVHQAVAHFYDDHWDEPAPRHTPQQRRSDGLTRRYAMDQGWVPSLAWDDIDRDAVPADPTLLEPIIDEVAIELALAGDDVDLSDEELQIAFARGIERDLSHRVLMERLDMSRRAFRSLIGTTHRTYMVAS